VVVGGTLVASVGGLWECGEGGGGGGGGGGGVGGSGNEPPRLPAKTAFKFNI